jgi:hypothetical protein
MIKANLPKGLGSGIHVLGLRVADEAGNVRSTSATFRVP